MRLRLLVLGAAALAAALGAPTAGAQEPGSATVVPIQVTGPPSERLNLVIMSDGYQADELDKFRADVDRNLNVQWSIEPFRTYRHYFNIYRLEIVSQDSGISCDPDDGNVRRNTPLRLNFANTCPADPLARGVTYGPALTPGTGCPALNAPGCTGTQQHNLFLSTYLTPLGVSGQNVQTLALANTFTYGGIGGTQATTSGGSPQGPLISTHELGHSLGQLADEYPYSSRDVVRALLRGRRAGLVPPHDPDERRGHDRDAAQVVALDRRREPLRRRDRALGRRKHVPVRRPPPEPALDDALAGLLLRPGRPREHDLPHHRPAERERDGAREHAARPGRAGGRRLGRDAASEVPRADRHLAGERRGRARHEQQPEPRPGDPERRRRRPRLGHGAGRDGLRPRPGLQERAQADADAGVDRRERRSPRRP